MWSGVEWSGVEWSCMVWCGVEWSVCDIYNVWSGIKSGLVYNAV